jgi:NNP family nitrate/nitrite transporter-like MFS transporter
MMFGVTGIPIRAQLGLDSTQFGLLSATPVLSGALFRLPLGVWTDRFGGRRIMIAVLVGCAVPLFVSGFATTYWQLLLLGLALGLVGATFSVGTPYVARFFPASKRGFAMGVFGAGTVGAAINMFVAPELIGAFGWQSVPKTYAVVLLITAAFFWLVSVPDPARRDPGSPSIAKQLGVLRDPRAWKYCQYYSIVFGGFTALSIWMPQYFKTEYGLPITAAALLAACFALPGGGFRALGGWLADRFGAHAVTWWVLWISWICLFLLSYPRTELSIATVNGPMHFAIALPVWLFTALLFVLGIAFACGMASTFKYIGNDYPDSMGVVSGIVGMVGGLGGFLLPIMFGALLDKTGINSSCFMLLYGIVSISLMLNYLTEVRRAPVMGEPVLSPDSAEGAA